VATPLEFIEAGPRARGLIRCDDDRGGLVARDTLKARAFSAGKPTRLRWRIMLAHSEHPRLRAYPLWREDLGAEPLPEQIERLSSPPGGSRACRVCWRNGAHRLARLAAKFGPEMACATCSIGFPST
jgi:hypothetical protein